MGNSDRQDRAEIDQQSIDDLIKQIQGTNTDVNNRFDNYHRPFNYDSKRQNLDVLHKLGLGDINRASDKAIADNTKGTVGRLASQGVTGGSLLDESVKKGQKNIYNGKFNAIRDLQKNTEAQDIGLMNQENRDKFKETSAASGIDFQNMLNLFRKYGLVQNGQRLSLGNLGNFSNSNTLDDIFSGLNAGANIGGAFNWFGAFDKKGSGNTGATARGFDSQPSPDDYGSLGDSMYEI